MKILLLGLNHKSAPVDIREKLAFDAESAEQALTQLKGKYPEAEFVLLSTCNRVEIYCAAKRTGGVTDEQIAEFIAEFHDIPVRRFREFLYTYRDEDAVRHLLTVASSLDSMVVGEAQIINQVKESYRIACAAKSTGKILNRLFHMAFFASKKVYTGTSISSGRVSVAGVAIELAQQLFADISAARVVVIGAGEMGELLVQHLIQTGARNITVVNRSYDRAVKMAERYKISAGRWDALGKQLGEANIVVASASVQNYLYTRKQFKKTVDRRRRGPLLLVDVSVPRNFDPAINKIDEVYLYSIDELSEVAEENRKAREEDIAVGLEIVYAQAAEFMNWFKARDIGPLIGLMKEEFAKIGETELERFFAGTRREAHCREHADQMVNRIVNKLVHCVIKNVDIVTEKHGPSEAAKFVDRIVQQAEEIAATANSKEQDSGE